MAVNASVSEGTVTYNLQDSLFTLLEGRHPVIHLNIMQFT